MSSTLTSEDLAKINKAFPRARRAMLIEIRLRVSRKDAPGRFRDPKLGTKYDLAVTLPFIGRITSNRCQEALSEALDNGLSLKALVRCDLSIPMTNQPITLAQSI